MRFHPAAVPAAAAAATSLRVSMPREDRVRGRYLAGVLAVAGSALLLHAGGGVAQAKTIATLPPVPPASVDSADNTADTYVISGGDTLTAIAKAKHVTVSALATVNGLANADHIVAGDTLIIPAFTPAVVTASPTGQPATKLTANARFPSSTPTPGGPLPPELVGHPERLYLRADFQRAASSYHVPLDLLQAMTWNESGWQNKVVSSTGAVGIGQLMPDTVDFVNQQLLTKPLNPSQSEPNILMSAAFLRYLLNETNNDPRLALAAYYQGLGSVQRTGMLPETQQYVRTVLAIQQRYF